MSVRAILEAKGSDVISVRGELTLHETAQILSRRQVGAVMVMDGDNKAAGLISERDIIDAIVAKGAAALKRHAVDFMSCNYLTCSPDDSVVSLMQVMTEKRVRHLPVIEKGQLTGIISIGDVVKRRIKESQREAEALKDYIKTG